MTKSPEVIIMDGGTFENYTALGSYLLGLLRQSIQDFRTQQGLGDEPTVAALHTIANSDDTRPLSSPRVTSPESGMLTIHYPDGRLFRADFSGKAPEVSETWTTDDEEITVVPGLDQDGCDMLAARIGDIRRVIVTGVLSDLAPGQ